MQFILNFFDIKPQSDAQRSQVSATLQDGVKTIAPTLPAMAVWAVVTAVAMIAAGMPAPYVILINLVVYAASAQLTVLGMMMLHSPLAVVWLAAAAVNLRFVIFSAALKPYFCGFNLRQRLLYGFLSADMNSMLFQFRYRNQAAANANIEQKSFFVGMSLVNYMVWQLGVWTGVVFASAVPTSWGLELAGTLTLLALVIKACEHLAMVVGVIVAAAAAIAFQFLEYRLWVVVAIVAGVLAAMLTETVFPKAFLKWPNQSKNGVK
jgi:predicted branched-subunit amino acid permease